MDELSDNWEKKLKDWEEKQKDFKANDDLIDREIFKARKERDRNQITDAERAERERRMALLQIWIFRYVR